MDSTFIEFIAKAKKLGLCAEYTDKIDRAGSKKAFVDIALDANGLRWSADAIAKGMLTSGYISKEFAPFNNGRYVRDKGGYTSAMYCRSQDPVTINTTAALIIDCYNEIIINRSVCELYIVNSKARITGKGNGAIYLYNSTIANQSTAPVVVKEDRKYGTQNAI